MTAHFFQSLELLTIKLKNPHQTHKTYWQQQNLYILRKILSNTNKIKSFSIKNLSLLDKNKTILNI